MKNAEDQQNSEIKRLGLSLSAKPATSILLIDNNPAETLLLQYTIEDMNAGLSLDSAQSIEDAKALLSVKKYSVILLDLDTHNKADKSSFINFYALCREVPVLVLVAPQQEHLGIEAVQHGAQDYLLKSQLKQSLLDRFIRVSIERHHLQKKLSDIYEKAELERDMIALERLSERKPTGVTAKIYGSSPLRETDDLVFKNMVERYSVLLDHAVEVRRFNGQSTNGCAEAFRDLAEDLGVIKATPRDIIEIHTEVINSQLQRKQGRRAEAYREEGRFTVLELMGYLANFYRGVSIGVNPTEIKDE